MTSERAPRGPNDEVAGAMSSLNDVVYPSAEIVACPFDFYARLRKESPVHRLPNGDYLITRWEDIVHVTRHPEIFSNMIGPVTPQFAQAFGIEDAVNPANSHSPWPLPFSDPPEHRVKRALLQSLVRPDRILAYEPVVRRIANELIDGFIEHGRCDFKAAFADELPPRTMLEIFGVPPEDAQMLRGWMMASQGQGFRHASAQARAAHIDGLQKSKEYFRALISERAAKPREDFLSRLAQDKLARDGRLDLEYLVGEVNVLYQAAYHNTVYMLASVLLRLLRHPSVQTRILTDPSAIRRFTDEVLRLESPSQWLARHVLRDAEINGIAVPAGSMLLIVFGAANRDEAHFNDPDAFDIDRPRLTDQLAFGHGIHMCLGQSLARLEAKVTLEQLLCRLTNIRLTPDHHKIEYLYIGNKRAPAAVPIEFERR